MVHLSDIDTINGKPAIEWDDDLYGRFWTTYEDEEEMQAALDRYEREVEDERMAQQTKAALEREFWAHVGDTAVFTVSELTEG